ncbi:hypothetical protein SISSUDRAFT_1053262, partial [Sistotremastrum suecicum HHB10207 ss-3]
MNANATVHDALLHNHNEIHAPHADNINNLEMFMTETILDPPAEENHLYYSYRLPDDLVEQLEDIGIPRHFLYRRKDSPCAWVEKGIRCRKTHVKRNGEWRRHLHGHVARALN